jgi:hypothetical protein
MTTKAKPVRKRKSRARQPETPAMPDVPVAPPEPVPVHPHTWTDGGDKVLILRRIDANGTSNSQRLVNGQSVTREPFRWPDGINVEVQCDDWDPRPVCGGGLHGWAWGMGLGDGADYDIIADRWLVLAADPADVVGELEKGWKCKCRRAIKLYDGPFAGAWAMIRSGQVRCIEAMAKANPAANGQSTVAGDNGKSTVAGYNGQSTVAGYNGQSTVAGDYGKSTVAGYNGQSTVAGDNGKSTVAGDYGKAAAEGKDTIAAVAGHGGKVKVGQRGAFALAYWTDADGWRFLTGKVGENGVKADTWYCVRDGKIVEA